MDYSELNQGCPMLKNTKLGDAMNQLVNAGDVPGATIYADGTNGSNSNDGSSWLKALKTLTHAVAISGAGGIIYAANNFAENVTVPVGLTGLMLIGVGSGPVQALWQGVTSGDCLTINAANVLVTGFKFRTTTGQNCITFPAAANYTRIMYNRFQGSTGSIAAIENTVPAGNVEIGFNEFIYFNTLTTGIAIYGVDNSGTTAHSGWKIHDNIFDSCVSGINITGRNCSIWNNHFSEYGLAADNSFPAQVCTKAIDLSGTGSGANYVHGNYIPGTYNNICDPGASHDEWVGNFLPGGLSTANPT